MAEEIKELIEKIQQEGIQAAEEKARQIIAQAQKEAERILDKVKLEAGKIIIEAKDKAVQTQEGAHALLKQAGRDLLLALRKEIKDMLGRIVLTHVRQAQTAEELTRIIAALIKESRAKEEGAIIVALKKEDLEKIENALFTELGERLRKGIVLKPSEEISGGFMISYDSGRSYYDFSDEALAEYIGTYLKPRLSQILKTE